MYALSEKTARSNCWSTSGCSTVGCSAGTAWRRSSTPNSVIQQDSRVLDIWSRNETMSGSVGTSGARRKPQRGRVQVLQETTLNVRRLKLNWKVVTIILVKGICWSLGLQGSHQYLGSMPFPAISKLMRCRSYLRPDRLWSWIPIMSLHVHLWKCEQLVLYETVNVPTALRESAGGKRSREIRHAGNSGRRKEPLLWGFLKHSLQNFLWK